MAELKAPTSPAGASPSRRPGSIRRTSTLDTSWPEGLGQPSIMRGHARDLLTPSDGGPAVVLAEDSLEITVAAGREIAQITASRLRDSFQQFVGARGGGHLRKEIARLLPEEQAAGTALHLLLDDFSGASLVSGWAWSRWTDGWMQRLRTAGPPGPGAPGRNGQMEGVCAGFRPGSTALSSDGAANPTNQSATRVPPLPHPDDPLGWHALAQQEGVGMRRARRLDLWLDEGLVHLDIGFQDSATAPDGGDRIAVHEYQVSATADPQTFELLSVVADPRILPYGECPAASPNTPLMLGASLGSFRREVLARLPGTLGCTHLNDVLRSMADAPQLIRRLREA
jgi:hypothetical protein